MGYGIYGLVWNDETMSQYTNMRGLIDAVFVYDGKIKGIFMTFLLNSAAVSFERVLVFVGLIITDIKRKRNVEKGNDNAMGSNTKTAYDYKEKKESIGADNDRVTEEPKEEKETTTEFFKGVKNLDDLKKRYHDLLKIYHPDNNSGDTEVTVKIKEEFELLEKQFLNK